MSMDVIAKILKELGGNASIRPDADAFRARVMDKAAEQLDEVYENLEEAPFDVEVHLESDPDPRKIAVTIRALSPDFDHTMRLYAYQLNSTERSALLRELLTHKRRQEAMGKVSKPKVIVRKKSDNSYDLHAAAQKLAVGSEWFKKNVPCTAYNCAEGDDGSKVLNFRYHREMVDRLCKMMQGSSDEEDLKQLADLCCEGDKEWAQEIVDALKSKRRSTESE